MKYTEYMEEAGKTLADIRQYPTDEHLVHYIKLLALIEQVSSVFGYGHMGEQINLTPERIQLSVKTFLAQLEQIHRGFPSNVNDIRNSFSCLTLIP